MYRRCCSVTSLEHFNRLGFKNKDHHNVIKIVITWPACSVYHSAGHGCFPHASWLVGLGSLHLLSLTSNSTPCESSTQNTSRDLTPYSPSLQLFVQSVHSPISHLEGHSGHMSPVVRTNCPNPSAKTPRPCGFFFFFLLDYSRGNMKDFPSFLIRTSFFRSLEQSSTTLARFTIFYTT